MLRRHRFAARRRAVGLSQDKLAEITGVDRSTVGRWEAGETEPQPWIRPRIATALNVTAEELEDLLTGGGSEPSGQSERLADSLARPHTTDLISVAVLRQQVADLATAYDHEPSAGLLTSAGQALGQIGFLRQHVTTTRIRQELLKAESEAAILMGKLVWDASGRRERKTPLSCLDQAIAAARQLGDKTGEGHALLRQSYIALYSAKDGAAGRKLAEKAAATTRRTSKALTGIALLHAAEGSAMLGQRTDCEKALKSAESFLDRVDSDDSAAELFSPSQFGRLAGSCYLFLEDPVRAKTILSSTAGQLKDQNKSRAIVLGNLTMACLRQGALDEAVAWLNEAIDLIGGTRGGGGLTVVFAAGRELRPWRGERVVQDVYDRLLDLMTTPYG